MNVHECAWVCMNMHKYAWMCMNLCMCMNVHECAWMCMNVHECAWMCMKVHESAWMLMNAFGSEWGSAPSSLFVYIYPHHVDEYMWEDEAWYEYNDTQIYHCFCSPNGVQGLACLHQTWPFSSPRNTLMCSQYLSTQLVERKMPFSCSATTYFRLAMGPPAQPYIFFPLLTFLFYHLLRAQFCIEICRHYSTTTDDRVLF